MAVRISERRTTAGRDFDAFYRGERDKLRGALALALGDAELAAEAVDEGMVRAYQRWSRIGRYDNPAGWVYRVARNWAVSRLRTRRRSGAWVPSAEPAVTDPDPPDLLLAAALDALPEAQRTVLVLRFHLDWSVDRIAAAVGAPAGTVKSRLHRGLAALRAAVAEQEGTA